MSTPSITASQPRTREIAPGIRQVSVGAPFATYVYLLDSPDGVIAFDAGIRGSGPEILAAAGGSITRVILSHSHADHRGGAKELGAPIYCHPDELADAQAAWPQPYLDFSLVQNSVIREAVPRLNEQWDSGPLSIAGTVQAGEEIAGLTVIHAPGHAPGEIALFRAADRVLIAGDVMYTLDFETGQPVPARVPHPAANWDTERARASIRSLIALDPASVWLGHSDQIDTDVVATLERAAAFAY